MCWDNFRYLIPSIYNVSLIEKSESALNLDLKNTAGAKKITYSGTAEIGPKIIEGGLRGPYYNTQNARSRAAVRIF